MTEQAFRSYKRNRRLLTHIKDSIRACVTQRDPAVQVQGGKIAQTQHAILEAWESNAMVQKLTTRCEAVEKAVDSLRDHEDLYDVVMLYYFNEYSMLEVADMWGCSDTALKYESMVKTLGNTEIEAL
ncbi:MAG: hypothetical protein ACP5DY_03790 [Thermovirgaceae bacterium]